MLRIVIVPMLLVLCFALSATVWTQDKSSVPRGRFAATKTYWEYKISVEKAVPTEEQLNEWGGKGWELVSVLPVTRTKLGAESQSWNCYFKRKTGRDG